MLPGFLSFKSKLFYTTLFAIAMAYLESAVVVYLRMLYYPNGFTFPLVEIPSVIWIIETGREAATIVMLFTVSVFLANNKRERFAYFAFTFGVWDIWYYIWLKLFLDWPASLLDWDILFLIPIPWVGPVLAPILVSASLITAGLFIIKYKHAKLNRWEWGLEIVCGFIIIFSFLTQTQSLSLRQTPVYYSWPLFMLGWLTGLFIFFRRIYLNK